MDLKGHKTFKEMMDEQEAIQAVIAKELLLEIDKKHIVIGDYTESYKKYKSDLVDVFYHYMTQGFEYPWFREHIINFRFEKGGNIHSMQLRNFLTNIIFWSAIVRIDADNLDDRHIIDCTKLSTKLIKSYIDNFLLIPYRKDRPFDKLNSYIHDLVYDLSMISNDYNDILGISMDLEMFINLAKRNPRFNEILRTKIPDSMQISESEEYLNKLTKEHMDIIRNDPEYNHLKPIMNSSGSIKSGQYREFAVNRGPKPDLAGVTMPIVPQSNYLVGGLNTIATYFTEGLAGRKSLIMNKVVMGNSGHFSRLISLVTSDIILRSDEEECGTRHPISYEIKTRDHLHKLINRYYRQGNQLKYSVIRGDEDHLIGTSILVRSPITCASKEGICKKCYGDLFYTNRKLNSPGGHSATEISEPVTQNVLSTKHLLATDSETVAFNTPFFKELFSVFGNEIMLNVENDKLEGHQLIIIANNIINIDDSDEYEGITKFIPLFHIRTPSGSLIEMHEANHKDLYLTTEFTQELKNYTRGRKKVDTELDAEIITIPLDSIEHNMGLFVVQINNNEKTRPLYAIMELLDNKKKRAENKIGNDHELIARNMLDLMIESEITAHAIHSEMIIRALVRSKKDILDIPNFQRYDAHKDIEMMTIKSALNNHPSITVSLSFQYLSKQFESPLTFKKDAQSYLDPFFKSKLDMEYIKKRTASIEEEEE